MTLPINEIKSQLIETLKGGNRAILAAPTGSGKSTQVPGMLLGLGEMEGGVVVLQPRRLAARLLARRVAQERGSTVGREVGYQTRFDSKVSSETRILFVTEGLFLRLLENDPQLSRFGAVVLDEFHQRHLAGDLALGIVKRLQETVRPDLKLVIMSATLDVRRLAPFLDCPVLETEGRLHPVTESYLERPEDKPVWQAAARQVRQLLKTTSSGDLLVFMPGRYEIGRTVEELKEVASRSAVGVYPLYSGLPLAQQLEAVEPGSGRKVIVATNVAETSITIEGVSHVVDAGLVRMARFDAGRGMDVLNLERISASSASQRAGRAGRTGPGHCVRLWTRLEQNNLRKHDVPEVLRLDLASAMLQSLALGVRPQDFPWLDQPDPGRMKQSLSTLHLLGAVDSQGRLTDAGRKLALLPMHPRLGRLLLEAGARGCLDQAALWAALIAERSILVVGEKPRFEHPDDSAIASDFLILEEALAAAGRARFDSRKCKAMGLHGDACRQVAKAHKQFITEARQAGLDTREKASPQAMGRAVLAAYADHLSALVSAEAGVYESYGSGRGKLSPTSAVAGAQLVVPAVLHESSNRRGASSSFSLATRIERAWLEDLFPGRLRREEAVVWDDVNKLVVKRNQLCFDHLVVFSEDAGAPDPGEAAVLMADRILAGQMHLKAWDDAVKSWIERVRFVSRWFPERGLLAYDNDDMRIILEEFCSASPRFAKLEKLLLLDNARSALSWADQQFVNKMAPERVKLPRGWRMKVRYEAGGRAIGQAKIQDLYDLADTPTVAGGRCKVLLEILAPNFRPVQTTDDLAGFWKNWYPKVKRQLSRRYPRHEWR